MTAGGFPQVLGWLEAYGGVTSFQLVPKEAGQRSQAVIAEYAGPAVAAAALKRLSEAKVGVRSIACTCTAQAQSFPACNYCSIEYLGNIVSALHRPNWHEGSIALVYRP